MSQEPTSFIKPLPPPQMLFVTQLREGRWPVPVPAPAMALCNALAGGRQWLHVGRCSHPATSAAHPTHFVRDALSAHAIVTSASGLFLYHFCCSKVSCAPCCRLSGRLRMSASALWVYNHGVHGRWYRRLCVLPDHTPIPTGARLFTTARPSHLSSVCVVFWDPLAPEGPRWQLGAGGGVGGTKQTSAGSARAPSRLPTPSRLWGGGRQVSWVSSSTVGAQVLALPAADQPMAGHPHSRLPVFPRCGGVRLGPGGMLSLSGALHQ